MESKQRQRKLANAEAQLSRTRRRINRLMTAQSNWQRRVVYHSRCLTEELTAERQALSVGEIRGRKFR